MRVKKFKKILNILKIAALAIIIAGLWFSLAYHSAANKPLDKNGEIRVFTVRSGQSVKTVAKSLKEEDLIRSAFFFRMLVDNSGQAGNIQAGAYELSTAMAAKEILEKFVSGDAVQEEMTVKIYEGWTRRDLAEKTEKWGMGSKEEFYALVGKPMAECLKDSPAIKDYSEEFDFLADKPACQGLEGYLFPDTYRLYKDAKTEDLIYKMLENFNDKLTLQMRDDIKAQGKTIHEIITMASVIQKEVRSERDMNIASGIFWNRIASERGLESCATLAYILGINKAIYSIADTQVDSSYNTYRNLGLPPGPISNPGLRAIKAAIYPAETDYFYFLSRPDTGETIFSRTYAEHLSNKEKYLK